MAYWGQVTKQALCGSASLSLVLYLSCMYLSYWLVFWSGILTTIPTSLLGESWLPREAALIVGYSVWHIPSWTTSKPLFSSSSFSMVHNLGKLLSFQRSFLWNGRLKATSEISLENSPLICLIDIWDWPDAEEQCLVIIVEILFVKTETRRCVLFFRGGLDQVWLHTLHWFGYILWRSLPIIPIFASSSLLISLWPSLTWIRASSHLEKTNWANQGHQLCLLGFCQLDAS